MSEISPSPLVSVIIPCYNAEKYLPETIQSVLEQSYKEYEIIVVDDGSTDKSSEIIKSYGNKINSIFSENRGASSARNIGTNVSKGELIQYLDSDDILDFKALENRVEAILNSDADVVYSDWQELKEDKKGIFHKGITKTQRIEDVNSNLEIALFTRFWAPPAAYLFKSSTVKKINGFKEELTYGEDARFVFDAARYGAKFIKIDGVGAYYRIANQGNLSRSNPAEFLNDIYSNTRDVESIWLNSGYLSREAKRCFNQQL